MNILNELSYTVPGNTIIVTDKICTHFHYRCGSLVLDASRYASVTNPNLWAVNPSWATVSVSQDGMVSVIFKLFCPCFYLNTDNVIPICWAFILYQIYSSVLTLQCYHGILKLSVTNYNGTDLYLYFSINSGCTFYNVNLQHS